MKHIYDKKDLEDVKMLDEIIFHYCGKPDISKRGFFGELEENTLTLILKINGEFRKDVYHSHNIWEGHFDVCSELNTLLSEKKHRKHWPNEYKQQNLLPRLLTLTNRLIGLLILYYLGRNMFVCPQ